MLFYGKVLPLLRPVQIRAIMTMKEGYAAMIPTYYLETSSTDPAYNLAVEEYALTHFREGNLLMLWQNAPSVIIGRNQNTAEEINQDFVNSHNIRVVRRNTGGGAVYHDLGNLNYSFITDVDGTDRQTYERFVLPIVSALVDLGLDACSSGRNDILVSGKKVSGTAQQILKGRILHHGTLLFDTDAGMIQGALNPDPEKFRSKSVKSVRSRVGNIRSFLSVDMMVDRFWEHLKSFFLVSDAQQIELTPDDLQAIVELKEKKYDTWEWNYGRSPKCQIQSKNRYEGGSLDIRFSVESGKITEIHIFGDYLAVKPIEELEERLIGCERREDSLMSALEDVDLSEYLGTITIQELIHTICN